MLLEASQSYRCYWKQVAATEVAEQAAATGVAEQPQVPRLDTRFYRESFGNEAGDSDHNE